MTNSCKYDSEGTASKEPITSENSSTSNSKSTKSSRIISEDSLISGLESEQNPKTSDQESSKLKPQVIFFGNGPLADYALEVLQAHTEIIFHARTATDLARAAELKRDNPTAYGVLASFGVLIRSDLLELFEPEGILNLHPSLLPQYRGPSPIESAILAGDQDFSYSIMKLAKKMDAGPIYHQDTLSNLPLDKLEIYKALATAGAKWLVDNLPKIRELQPAPQNDQDATYTNKLTKEMSVLQPDQYPAREILRQIVAYQGFPKPKYAFFGKTCIILKAHLADATAIVCDPSIIDTLASPLMIKCADRNFIAIDELQPEGKKPMSAKAFINGYGKKQQF